ncbi:ras association domain-containing protein 8 [Oncorhynchus kisutch]|uniref:ras association domain-containing protein 8 n=1 Tax=Oncorhynchus kisutch TaxID=8019 RepID=UPI0012DC8547|nr:ras association domain-containing protein 8 [Oncorhynchus kisutch]XP_031678763.1 ras association domain-containing protein 8 [Oncorhynchus kisutch]XP_031678764.1 ras association domain-containing protein 8 [Oncorhynchus kisutch]XP_031678765.1 ras association domain-containing protein 8 [Oncorhynchus kisutch]XP_031678766.1 ras association domain-containing protein 8 [Oncorhynchus kisutch]XP_031678767.1 ras association domain-containing protein 8 [Oncorhynchus kisutch]XP_031678768.1 ras asso
MELKVWVDGVVRVVCGLSEETSCQDVVIALAQAIGQTGRYVLIQRLRDSERQLLANEKPLESLAKLGQHSNDVQFFLRRTGPSSSDGPGSGSGTSQDRVTPLPLPKHPDPEPLKHNQPKKSLTFNLGPSTSPRTKAKQLIRKSPRDSPEQRTSPSPIPPHHAPSSHSHSPSPSPPVGPSKEEVFRQVLQQQERLRAIEAQLETMERDSRSWNRASPAPSPVPEARLPEEMEALEQAARRNQAELAHETFWEEELQAEVERERGMRRRLGELHSKMDDCGRRLHDFSSRSAQLEQQIQRESLGGAAQPGRANQAGGEESLGAMRAELQSQGRHSEELEGALSETDKALGKAETLLQEKQEELEELNKELRQCNLQQFIQQAGVLPTHTHSRTDLSDQLELAHLLQEGYRNGGLSLLPSESPPRPTAKQFLGHPRNLQNPLVSSLNPEVVTSRESSWR